MLKLQGSKAEVEEDLKDVRAQLHVAEEEVEKSVALHEKIKELETRTVDAETVEKGLQNAIDKWTDKAFEWREKADMYVAKLMKLKEQGDNYQPKQVWGIF